MVTAAITAGSSLPVFLFLLAAVASDFREKLHPRSFLHFPLPPCHHTRAKHTQTCFLARCHLTPCACLCVYAFRPVCFSCAQMSFGTRSLLLLRGGTEPLQCMQDTNDSLLFLAQSVDVMCARVHLARETMSHSDILGSPAAQCVRQTFATTSSHIAFLAAAVEGGGGNGGCGYERQTTLTSVQTTQNTGPGSGQAQSGGQWGRRNRRSKTPKIIGHSRPGLCAAVWMDEIGIDHACQRSASFGCQITRRAQYCKRHTPSSFVCAPSLDPHSPPTPCHYPCHPCLSYANMHRMHIHDVTHILRTTRSLTHSPPQRLHQNLPYDTPHHSILLYC